MRARLRGGRALSVSGAAAAGVTALAVLVGLQVSGLGLLPDLGGAGPDGRGVFTGSAQLPALTGRFTGEADDEAPAAEAAPTDRTSTAGRPAVLPAAEGPQALPPVVVRQGSNDDVAAAREVLALPYADRADARTREAGEPTSCAPAGPTAWYRYRAPVTDGLSAIALAQTGLEPITGTALGVFTGDARPQRQVACSTRDATVDLAAVEGTTYWFQVVPARATDVQFRLQRRGPNRLGSATATGSVPDAGAQGPSLSADGSTLVFTSDAQDLHPDVDRTCRSPFDALVNYRGGAAPPDSTRHRYLRNPGACSHLYARDLRTGRVELLDRRPDGRSGSAGVPRAGAAVNADGRFVAFWMYADDVVPGDRSPGPDLVVRDRRLGRWHLLRNAAGQQPVQAFFPGAPVVLSPDGRYAAFTHGSPQLAPVEPCPRDGSPHRTCWQVYRWDLRTGAVVRITRRADGGVARGGDPWPVGVTDAGRVTFLSDAPDLVPGDTNGAPDLFQSGGRGGTVRVSVDRRGRQLPLGVISSHHMADVSADGAVVAFRTSSPAVPDDDNGLPDVYVRDLRRGDVQPASVDDRGQFAYQMESAPVHRELTLTLSADGRWVAFMDNRRDLLPGDVNEDTDVFLHDRRTGRLSYAVLWPDGQPEAGYNGHSPDLSGDGRLLAFGGGRMDGRPESGCYCHQVWTRVLR